MLHKTEAIVLNFIKYGESSIITKIYTEKFGLQTYIVNGARGKSNKNKISLFQPLTLLDLVVYLKENANLQRIAEINCNYQFNSIPYDQRKNAILFFLQELLLKILVEQMPNAQLFNFLQTSLKILDTLELGYENFHLHFLLKFANHLGIAASDAEEIVTQLSPIPVNSNQMILITNLINSDYGSHHHLSQVERRNILEILVKFYSVHITAISNLNSIAILKEVFG